MLREYNYIGKGNDSRRGKSLSSCAYFVWENRRIDEGHFEGLDADRRIILKRMLILQNGSVERIRVSHDRDK